MSGKIKQFIECINDRGKLKSDFEYLTRIIKTLGEITGNEYVLVSRITPQNTLKAEVLAFYSCGKMLEKFSYDLKGIQKQNIEGKNLCIYRREVQKAFPDDEMLSKLNIQSYLGKAVTDSNGIVTGLIAVLRSDNPGKKEIDEIAMLLNLAAPFISQFIENIRLKAINESLEKKCLRLSAKNKGNREKRISGARSFKIDFIDRILEIFPGLFFIFDVTQGLKKAELVKFNEKWYSDNLGYDADEITSSFPDFFITEKEKNSINEAFAATKKNKYVEIEMNMIHREGYEIPYLYIFYALSFQGSDYLLGFGIDISVRKYSETALKQSELYFKKIFNSSIDGILILDPDGKIINANESVFRLLGCKFEEIAFKNFSDFLAEESRVQFSGRIKAVRNGEAIVPYETLIRNSSGISVPVEETSVSMNFHGTDGILTIIRDINERKVYEKKIINSEVYTDEKERERYAYELHDGLGPVLSTIKIYLQSLTETLEANEEQSMITGKTLSLIDDALVSIREISNNLSPHILRNLGIGKAVLSYARRLEQLYGIRFEVSCDFVKRINDVIEFTVYRIITELINNTIKHSKATSINIGFSLTAGCLKVSYSDNGKGFDPDVIKSSGNGLGLQNIESRIKKFNGNYSYQTSPGNGVKVEFSLDTNQKSSYDRIVPGI